MFSKSWLRYLQLPSKEEYAFYKGLGLCVRCFKNQAEPNKVLCLECSDDDSEYRRKWRNKNLEKCKKRDTDKYHRLKELGICTYCKHEKAVPGQTKCAKCRAKIRNKRNEKQNDICRSERVAYGICYICGKENIIPGKGVCEKCYKTRMQSIQKIMHLPVSDYWKNDNKLVFKNSRKE